LFYPPLNALTLSRPTFRRTYFRNTKNFFTTNSSFWLVIAWLFLQWLSSCRTLGQEPSTISLQMHQSLPGSDKPFPVSNYEWLSMFRADVARLNMLQYRYQWLITGYSLRSSGGREFTYPDLPDLVGCLHEVFHAQFLMRNPQNIFFNNMIGKHHMPFATIFWFYRALGVIEEH
jgi:hypothetical protein